jgi:outer membrane protein assembly factor BamB
MISAVADRSQPPGLPAEFNRFAARLKSRETPNPNLSVTPMKFNRSLTLLLPLTLAGIAGGAVSAEWNQWRGPGRNGVLPSSVPLLNAVPEAGLKLLWESEPIPANDDGGHGSPVVAGGRVYLSLAWHRDVPSETRTITDLMMRQLGYQNPAGLGPEVVEKMERARQSLSPSLRGAKLDEFIDQFIKDNLNRRQQQTMSGFVRGRFKKGRLAIPLEDYAKLDKMVDKPFPSDAAWRQWVEAQGFADHVKEEVLKAMPPSERVAEDVILALDVQTGKTLWKTAVPGEPKGRNCSSTPAVAEGRVYGMGSVNLMCVDAAKGDLIWKAPLPGKAPGSSPLVVNDVVVINAGKLAAYDAKTGKQLWLADKLGGGQSSPVAWTKDGRTFVILNSRNELAAVDLHTGKTVWTTPGGGDSTPAIDGDFLAVQSRNATIGLAVFKLRPDGVTKLWNIPMDAVRTQSSPIIHDGHVFLMDDGQHLAVGLESGSVAWKQSVPSNISSPVIADGKIWVLMNSGNNLQVLKATGAERVELGKANVRVLWCPSPTIADGRLLLRSANSVRCYDLTADGRLAAAK